MDIRASGSAKREDGLERLEPPTGTTTVGPVSVASSISASSGPSRRAAIDLTQHDHDMPAHSHRAVGWSSAPISHFPDRNPLLSVEPSP
jgi:hypothetical protein